MKRWLTIYVRWTDRLNTWIGSTVVTVAVLLFILVIFSNVVLRYVFNTSFVFMAELEWHLFAFVFLVGAGFTLLHDRHVRVDIFYSRMRRHRQAWVNLIGVVGLLIPCCYLVLTTTIPWVVDAYRVGETSLDPGGIQARFLIKAALPLGYLLMLLQGISLGIKSAFILAGSPLPQEPEA
ncbi:MAG: TRAP transporter small permease subunit [Desulfosarcinaceae bacterium]|nr:TRAP transporter small permease subunit [Desulfosarcinaceae bacterium]